MQVIEVHEFGGPEVLQVGEADLPQPNPGEVLVRVLAAGVGPWPPVAATFTERKSMRESCAALWSW